MAPPRICKVFSGFAPDLQIDLKGPCNALTIIGMLTGLVWCIPIPDKTANAILKPYLQNVHHIFGPSRKILSDNGTEFKNDLFDRVAKELGI